MAGAVSAPATATIAKSDLDMLSPFGRAVADHSLGRLRGGDPAQALAAAVVVVALRADDDGTSRGGIGEVLPAVAPLTGARIVGHELHPRIGGVDGTGARNARAVAVTIVADVAIAGEHGAADEGCEHSDRSEK